VTCDTGVLECIIQGQPHHPPLPPGLPQPQPHPLPPGGRWLPWTLWRCGWLPCQTRAQDFPAHICSGNRLELGRLEVLSLWICLGLQGDFDIIHDC